MRLAVFGNSEFVSNSALQNVQGSGNQDLFAGAINWLAEEEEYWRQGRINGREHEN